MNQTLQNILVTGGNGRIGQRVVRLLHQHGYNVTNADMAPHPSEFARSIAADLTDLEQVTTALRGQDGVIHLAAIPGPGFHPSEVIFKNNMLSSFNVLHAATELGIRRVVLAGSVSALGFTFAHRRFNPLTIPIDEQHPFLPQDVYGMTKSLLEELGQSFARRTPDMAITSLRFTIVLTPDEIRRDIDNPPYDQSSVFWSYVDVRDAAEACRLALEKAPPGFDAMYIAAPDSLHRAPVRELLAQAYPGAESLIPPDFKDHQSILSSEKAREKLGFVAQYTWERVLRESDAT
jgi:nucleoside-diphosphate-sugar epimerase